MANSKIYADPMFYEQKLKKVMARFNISDGEFDWDFSRAGGWVSFRYKEQYYRFEQTVERAKAHGQKITYGSDAFAQVVLALEDLARLVERGLYDLQTWIEGMKMLPAKTHIPDCFEVLQFDHVPDTKEEVEKQFRIIAKTVHPDTGGSATDFTKLVQAKEEAIKIVTENSSR